MFVLKQFLKNLLLPPNCWIIPLVFVAIFWKRRWARKLLVVTIIGAAGLHSATVARLLGYYLETRYPAVGDCRGAGTYDAIVVLTGSEIVPGGLIRFPSLDEASFRRVEEAVRLYRQQPKPVIVSGGHVNPFTVDQGENGIVCSYVVAMGVPAGSVIAEPKSRDTFESAAEVGRILRQKGWKRYLLVTSARHMPRSMMVFRALAPEPVAAPGGFTIPAFFTSPLDLFPREGAGFDIMSVLNEYAGLVNYRWRLWWTPHPVAPGS